MIFAWIVLTPRNRWRVERRPSPGPPHVSGGRGTRTVNDRQIRDERLGAARRSSGGIHVVAASVRTRPIAPRAPRALAHSSRRTPAGGLERGRRALPRAPRSAPGVDDSAHVRASRGVRTGLWVEIPPPPPGSFTANDLARIPCDSFVEVDGTISSPRTSLGDGFGDGLRVTLPASSGPFVPPVSCSIVRKASMPAPKMPVSER